MTFEEMQRRLGSHTAQLAEAKLKKLVTDLHHTDGTRARFCEFIEEVLDANAQPEPKFHKYLPPEAYMVMQAYLYGAAVSSTGVHDVNKSLEDGESFIEALELRVEARYGKK